ncbi:Ribonuclease H-like domain containing protein [Rhypophila sp. PSN 637]
MYFLPTLSSRARHKVDARQYSDAFSCKTAPKPDVDDYHTTSLSDDSDDYDEPLISHPCIDSKPKYCGLIPVSRFPRAPWLAYADDPVSMEQCDLDLYSIVVAVDGVCPDNGGNANKSGCGVYFGERFAKKHNLHWHVLDDYDCRHTSQRAELHAAIKALEPFFAVVRVGGQRPGICCWANHIIVRSDSAYLVEGITRHANKWIQNGWMTAHGKPVANSHLWKVLIEDLRLLEGLARWVDFWLVKREHNTDAHHLANRALKRASPLDKLYPSPTSLRIDIATSHIDAPVVNVGEQSWIAVTTGEEALEVSAYDPVVGDWQCPIRAAVKDEIMAEMGLFLDLCGVEMRKTFV